jgi:hypothetical protein
MSYTASVVFTFYRYSSRQRAFKAKDALLELLTKIMSECNTFTEEHSKVISSELNLIEPAKNDLLKKADAVLYNLPSQIEGNLFTPISTVINALKTILYGSCSGNDFTIPSCNLKLISTLDQISGEAAMHTKIIEEAASSSTVIAGAASALTSMALLLFFPGGNDQEVVGDQDLKEEEF